jgi:hypothetical protein
MDEYLNEINKFGEFVYNNSDFCKSLELSFPIPHQTNNNKKLVCWYPASGADFTLLEQDLYLPIEGKMQEVKTFIYVDKQYYFVKDDESGLYSVIYGHNGTLCTGVLGKYLGFKCVLHVLDNKVCIFINSDIRLFEDLLIRNNIKVELVCFLPYGVPSVERPSRFSELKAQFFLGCLESELKQNFRLEIIQPELNYNMCGGTPHPCSLQEILPVKHEKLSPRMIRAKALRSANLNLFPNRFLLKIQADVFQIVDSRLKQHNGKTLQELLSSCEIDVEKWGDEYIIVDCAFNAE